MGGYRYSTRGTNPRLPDGCGIMAAMLGIAVALLLVGAMAGKAGLAFIGLVVALCLVAKLFRYLGDE
jgi:hypothetical protein